MWHSLTIGVRVVAVLAGLISIYAALSLYEDEQGRVQSTPEELWLRINEQRQAFLSRHAAFMREVARLANVGFDRLFGKKLLSWQAFCCLVMLFDRIVCETDG
jgi:hypothetical protein